MSSIPPGPARTILRHRGLEADSADIVPGKFREPAGERRPIAITLSGAGQSVYALNHPVTENSLTGPWKMDNPQLFPSHPLFLFLQIAVSQLDSAQLQLCTGTRSRRRGLKGVVLMNQQPYKGLKSKLGEIKFNTTRPRLVFIFLSVLLPSLLNSGASPALSIELKIHAAGPPQIDISAASRPDQLPQSRVARGNRNIITVWYAGPTDRYRHGVLGDRLEASRLVVETTEGKRLHIDLPPARVFEDLEPRLADLNGDNRDELIVVESDMDSGASLAVYGIVSGRLVRMAATPFLGQPNRWLNPLGVGDFDGDGHPDIALVATPHIGGRLRLYRFKDGKLSLFAEYPGVSTHRIGSRELGLGRVISAAPRDRLLVPNQARRTLMILEWSPDGWHEMTRAELPGTLASSLIPVEDGRWRFRLENGKSYEIQMEN